MTHLPLLPSPPFLSPHFFFHRLLNQKLESGPTSGEMLVPAGLNKKKWNLQKKKAQNMFSFYFTWNHSF